MSSDDTLRCFSVRHLTVKYKNGAQSSKVLDNLTLTLGPSSVAIAGPSGSGKSTLLRVLAGLQKPTSGSVQLANKPIESSPLLGIAKGVSFVQQEYPLIDFLNVRDNIALAAELAGEEISDVQIDELLEMVLLPSFAKRRTHTLSGGQRQRIAIARALAARPIALLADEPTGALDGEASEMVGRLLMRIPKVRNTIVIVATHDPTIYNLADDKMQLNNGKLDLAS